MKQSMTGWHRLTMYIKPVNEGGTLPTECTELLRFLAESNYFVDDVTLEKLTPGLGTVPLKVERR